MKMNKLLGLACGILLLLGVSRAHAGGDYGYVCYTNAAPPPANSHLGNYGGVTISFYSGPSCTGTFLHYGFFCSIGATYSSCSSILYPEATLNALYGNLQRAASVN